MLDEKDLHAIGQMLANQKKEILDESTHNMNILLENVVTPKLSLLAENQRDVLDKLDRLEDMDIMDTRISALEAMVKKLSRDINKLKQAN